jgi:hypothetical protein
MVTTTITAFTIAAGKVEQVRWWRYGYTTLGVRRGACAEVFLKSCWLVNAGVLPAMLNFAVDPKSCGHGHNRERESQQGQSVRVGEHQDDASGDPERLSDWVAGIVLLTGGGLPHVYGNA